MKVYLVLVTWTSRICLYLATACFIAISVLVALSAVTRYVASAPFAFTEELVGLLLCSMLFFSLPYALLEGRHIRIDLITRHLRGSWVLLTSILAMAVLYAFVLVFMYESYNTFLFTFRLKIKSEVAELLLYPWMAMIPISMLFVLFVTVVSEISWIRKFKAPSSDSLNS